MMLNVWMSCMLSYASTLIMSRKGTILINHRPYKLFVDKGQHYIWVPTESNPFVAITLKRQPCW